MEENKDGTSRTCSPGDSPEQLSFVQIRTFVRTHTWQTRTDGRDHGQRRLAV
jgi:hypothetical protein